MFRLGPGVQDVPNNLGLIVTRSAVFGLKPAPRKASNFSAKVFKFDGHSNPHRDIGFALMRVTFSVATRLVIPHVVVQTSDVDVAEFVCPVVVEPTHCVSVLLSYALVPLSRGLPNCPPLGKRQMERNPSPSSVALVLLVGVCRSSPAPARRRSADDGVFPTGASVLPDVFLIQLNRAASPVLDSADCPSTLGTANPDLEENLPYSFPRNPEFVANLLKRFSAPIHRSKYLATSSGVHLRAHPAAVFVPEVRRDSFDRQHTRILCLPVGDPLDGAERHLRNTAALMPFRARICP